ncbi:MAG: alcohol dehydrogenase catalytic domain-containing protein [Elusimicrobia bacterium]|nr:alcohol dehydrogenase catalytic domain-containing protein [Elusimicrobiota bacterium]
MPVPRIQRDEILIRVERASICGSDLAIYGWRSWAPGRLRLPLIFGHEVCGTVVEAGSATRGLSPGDFVSAESHIYCGLCYQCQNGMRHVCRNLKILGVDVPGGFAEFTAIPARCAWKHAHPRHRELGSLWEPFGNAVYATLAEEVGGKRVAVFGLGPQGLFAVGVARASGAERVIGVESVPFRKRLAKRMGADLVLDPRQENLVQGVRQACGGDGADAVLEMSGNPRAIEAGLKSVRSGGRFTAFGIPEDRVRLDYAEDIVFKGIRIYGIAGREIFNTWYRVESLLKRVDIRPVITHQFRMKDFRKAFAVLSSKEKRCGKVMLVP